MKQSITLFVCLILSSIAFGRGGEWMIPITVHLDSSKVDSSLTTDQALYHFEFNGTEGCTAPITITYTIDGVSGQQSLVTGPGLDILTTPGAHQFTFFLDSNHTVVSTDSLTIARQHKDFYSITFSRVRIDIIDIPQPDGPIQVITCKPLIYLYPQEEIEVSVKLDFEGENPFLFPAYNDGWECTASPNGDLTIGDDTYNYLFWEATQPDHLGTTDLKTGFIIEGSNAISFLQDKLTEAGLSSKEQADFITFWGLLLQKNELNFVRFEFNETCNKFAELSINPQPDNVYRIYIFFSPITDRFEVEDQEIESINRNGFSVLEWGGQISNTIVELPINL